MSAGTPMLLMGDEMRHTQLGNNNAYCQDSEVSWLDWGRLRRHADIHRFVRMLINYRRRRDFSQRGTRLSLNDLLSRARKSTGMASGCINPTGATTRIRWR